MVVDPGDVKVRGAKVWIPRRSSDAQKSDHRSVQRREGDRMEVVWAEDASGECGESLIVVRSTQVATPYISTYIVPSRAAPCETGSNFTLLPFFSTGILPYFSCHLPYVLMS